MRTEAADPSRLESGVSDGGTAFVRHLYKSGMNLYQINGIKLLRCVLLRFWKRSTSLCHSSFTFKWFCYQGVDVSWNSIFTCFEEV